MHTYSTAACSRRSLGLLFVLTAVFAGATEYCVGPGQAFLTPSDVPWETLQAGDTIRILWRAEPYRDKWVICAQGTEDAPIHIIGVPGGKNNDLPVIDGDGAMTRDALNYWGEERGLIKIGGANQPQDRIPQHIIVENLALRHARPPFFFTGRDGKAPYGDNAAGIYISKGEHITIRGCDIADCGNGIFTSYATSDILIEGCYVHENGIEDSIYHHNSYTESAGIRYQFNRFGPLRIGCFGNNIKDRSAGTVIHCNWIEGGSKLLDLVETTHEEIRTRPDYPDVVVAGNVFIKLAEANRPYFFHFGGDQANPEFYRLGTMYFFNNTVVCKRPGPVDVFKFGHPDQKCECFNNIFWGRHYSIMLALADANGWLNMGRNWVPIGFVSHPFNTQKHLKYDGNEFFTGIVPGFVDPEGDYHLQSSSNCVNNGVPIPQKMLDLLGPPLCEYMQHGSGTPRVESPPIDLGAYEYISPKSH